MTAADRFHAHLDACPRCERNPFDLCPQGAALIAAAAGEHPVGPIVEIAKVYGIDLGREPGE